MASRASTPDHISSHPHVVPLAAQVGGHPGVLTTEDGSLLIKPALPAEVAFYQSAATDASFAPLRPYLPKFYGTLRLEGRLDESETSAQDGEQIKVVPQSSSEGQKDEYPSFCAHRGAVG